MSVMVRLGLLILLAGVWLPVAAPVRSVGGAAAAASPAAGTAPTCFSETGQCVSELFYGYWQANGGLPQQGYPITPEFSETNAENGQSYRVQYFQRARFEAHNTPSGVVVRLGLIGREQYLSRYPQGRPAGGTGDVCFDITQRCVRGTFYAYWLSHGGLAQQGYPLSDEFEEVSPTDGATYRVQYFERARFEYHEEYRGTASEVLLGLVGDEQVRARYPNGVPASAPPPGATPAGPGPAPQSFYDDYLRTHKQFLRKQIIADMTGDGAAEVLLLVSNNGCGSCHLFYVLVFSGEVLLFSKTFDLVVPDEVAANADGKGLTVVEGFRKGNEALCCVTGRRTSVFGWNGREFVLLGVIER